MVCVYLSVPDSFNERKKGKSFLTSLFFFVSSFLPIIFSASAMMMLGRGKVEDKVGKGAMWRSGTVYLHIFPSSVSFSSCFLTLYPSV